MKQNTLRASYAFESRRVSSACWCISPVHTQGLLRHNVVHCCYEYVWVVVDCCRISEVTVGCWHMLCNTYVYITTTLLSVGLLRVVVSISLQPARYRRYSRGSFIGLYGPLPCAIQCHRPPRVCLYLRWTQSLDLLRAHSCQLIRSQSAELRGTHGGYGVGGKRCNLRDAERGHLLLGDGLHLPQPQGVHAVGTDSQSFQRSHQHFRRLQ